MGLGPSVHDPDTGPLAPAHVPFCPCPVPILQSLVRHLPHVGCCRRATLPVAGRWGGSVTPGPDSMPRRRQAERSSELKKRCSVQLKPEESADDKRPVAVSESHFRASKPARAESDCPVINLASSMLQSRVAGLVTQDGSDEKIIVRQSRASNSSSYVIVAKTNFK